MKRIALILATTALIASILLSGCTQPEDVTVTETETVTSTVPVTISETITTTTTITTSKSLSLYTVIPSSGPEFQYFTEYEGTGGGYPYYMAADNDGNIYIAGYTEYENATGNGIFTTIKYGSDGKQLWAAIYDNGFNGGVACTLAIDDSGNVYVAGLIRGTDEDTDLITVKYDTDGNRLWTKLYNASIKSWASSMAVDATGVYVAGGCTDSDGDKDFLTVKYDLNGNEIWQSVYDNPENSDDYATALAIDDSGNVYVTGNGNAGGAAEGGSSYLIPAETAGEGYITTLKYDTGGNLLWSAAYKGTGKGDDIASAIAVDSTGNIYVAGESNNATTGWDYIVIKYANNGSRLWAANYNGTANASDGAFDMTLDKSGDILVTGYSGGEATREYATLKYDTDGNQLWVAEYKSDYYDSMAYSIATDDAGNVYVTGLTGFEKYNSNQTTDYATVKYDKDGNELWVEKYGWGANYTAKVVALDSSGNIYVTGIGITNEAGSYAVITTLKYSEYKYSDAEKQGVIDEAVSRLYSAWMLEDIAGIKYGINDIELYFKGEAAPAWQAVTLVKSVIDRLAPGLSLKIFENVTTAIPDNNLPELPVEKVEIIDAYCTEGTDTSLEFHFSLKNLTDEDITVNYTWSLNDPAADQSGWGVNEPLARMYQGEGTVTLAAGGTEDIILTIEKTREYDARFFVMHVEVYNGDEWIGHYREQKSTYDWDYSVTPPVRIE